MKSAYAVLGVPGNADEADIRQAYERALAYYSKEKLVEDPSLVDRLNEAKEAYKILSAPDLRQLHDRKLSNAVAVNRPRPAPVVVEEEASTWSPLKIMLIAVIALFALGTYYSHVREEGRKAKLAHELLLKKQAEEAAAKAAAEEAAEEARRVRANALAEQKERQLRAESASIGRQVMASEAAAIYAQERRMQAERNAAQQEERQRRYEEQQRAYEAQRRTSDYQRQLRNLCMQNYGRPNC